MAFTSALKSLKDSRAVKSIRDKSPTNQFQVSLAGAQNSLDIYKPIYRISITYPITSQKDERVELLKTVTRTISATTNDLKVMIGLPISDLLGMWIDEDDMQEPDKVVILVRVDPKITRQTLTDENPLGDEQLALNRYFSVNHWLDIWLGYRQEPISQSIIGTTPNYVYTNKESLAYPENFHYLSDTHMFSGPIVLVNRTINKHGDRLSVSGFSAERILKECKIVSTGKGKTFLGISMYHDDGTEKRRTVGEGLKILFDSIIPWNDYWDKKKSDTLTDEWYFPLGVFFHQMLHMGFKELDKWFEKKRNQSGLEPVDGMINPKLFDKEMQSGVNLYGNVTFWDAVQKILSPEVSGSAGIGFRQKKGSHGLEMNSNVAYEEGSNEHPGIYWEFFFMLDVPEAQVFYSRMDNQEEFSGSGIPAKMFQNVILGQDVIDFETWIDSMGIFNSFKLMTSRIITSPDASPSMVEKKSPVKIPLEFDEASKIWLEEKRFEKVGGHEWKFKTPDDFGFWQAVYEDIMLYGEREFPLTKWISVDMDQLIDVGASELVDGLRKELEKNGTISTKYLLKTGLAFSSMFKRYFYGGLQGTAYCVGNPRLSVRRFVHFRDVRNAFTSPNTQSTFDGLSGLDQLHDRLTQLIGPSKLDKSNDPQNRITNFSSGVNELFYIWKVRHYVGAKSGYLTKIFFTKTRNRALRATTRDISGVLRNAQQNRREFMD